MIDSPRANRGLLGSMEDVTVLRGALVGSPTPFSNIVRKRNFESMFQLACSMSATDNKSFDGNRTPELQSSDEQLSGNIAYSSDSDSDVSHGPSSPVHTSSYIAEQSQCLSSDDGTVGPVEEAADAKAGVGAEEEELLNAASVILSLWNSSRIKRTKAIRSSFDEEAYVPKVTVRRTKKHVNKDVRIPNSCEMHKRRHLKCPVDCAERKRREAEQRLLDQQRETENALSDTDV